MSIVANLNISLRRSGGRTGSEDVTVPTVTASSALEHHLDVRLPAGFTTLVGNILTSFITLTGATGMIVQPSAESTATVWWGRAEGVTMGAICQAPYPGLVTSGLTISGVGLSCSAATTLTLIIF